MIALLALASLAPLLPQFDAPATRRSDVVFVVDAGGQGDFTSLADAVDAAPDGALLLVTPGQYAGATISSKSLRIHGEPARGAQITSPLVVESIGPAQEVHVSGLAFLSGFQFRDSAGELDLSACTALDDGTVAPGDPNSQPFGNCGAGLSRQLIENCDAVTVLDCEFEGREGLGSCDGSPGEHGLLVRSSRVTVYGGRLAGGRGGTGVCGHHSYPGAGGDGVVARGGDSLVYLCNVAAQGSPGGVDPNGVISDGCDGEGSRTFGGAVISTCASDSLSIELPPLVLVGTTPSYTISGPAGASVYLLIARKRAWREFPATAGLLHLGGAFQTVYLGLMPASGEITRPFPAPRPAWQGGYARLEIQAYALVGGADRYSEPRTLRVIQNMP